MKSFNTWTLDTQQLFSISKSLRRQNIRVFHTHILIPVDTGCDPVYLCGIDHRTQRCQPETARIEHNNYLYFWFGSPSAKYKCFPHGPDAIAHVNILGSAEQSLKLTGVSRIGKNKVKWQLWLCFRLNVSKIYEYSQRTHLSPAISGSKSHATTFGPEDLSPFLARFDCIISS